MNAYRLLALAFGLSSLHCGAADAVTTTREDAAPPTSDASAPLPSPGTSTPVNPPAANDAAPPCASSDGGGDELDDDGTDTNCDGADGVVGRDIYVSGVAGADTNAGTPREPLRTVAAALTKAKATGGSVLLTSGTYLVNALELEGRWKLAGGYGPAFVGKQDRAGTLIEPSSDGLLVAKAEHATLAHLTIFGASPVAGSALALRVRAKEVVLDDVAIESGDGLAGANGAYGAQGEPGVTLGAARCSATSPLQPRLGGNYATRQPPQAGVAGYPASDGADARGAPSLSTEALVVDRGTDGRDDGLAGDRGGLGGSGSGCEPYRAQCAEFHRADIRGGNGGGGGCPGKPGAGGTSGGASVGALVLEGKLVVRRSLIRTGFGGSGGNGGVGGQGGDGAFGSKPSVTLSNGVLNASCATNADDKLDVNCAAYGGRGGAGGTGGHGGGGAGGWTIGIATAPRAVVEFDDATVFDMGRPGNGGEGSRGGRAPDGQRRPTLGLTGG